MSCHGLEVQWVGCEISGGAVPTASEQGRKPEDFCCSSSKFHDETGAQTNQEMLIHPAGQQMMPQAQHA